MKLETKDSLDRYANDGVPPGHFLRAVLQNDLMEAFASADDQNRADMFEIVSYVHNDLPMSCHGSVANVRAWLNFKRHWKEGGVKR